MHLPTFTSGWTISAVIRIQSVRRLALKVFNEIFYFSCSTGIVVELIKGVSGRMTSCEALSATCGGVLFCPL